MKKKTADILVTPMVKKQVGQLEEDSQRYMTLAKVKGFNAVKLFLQTPSAKIGGYDIEENIPQDTHEKVMTCEIKTYQKLIESKAEIMSDPKYDFLNTYNYIYQLVESERRTEKIIVIDSIFIN